MHKNVSPLLSCLARSSKKPLLIMEASLKIRYFDFKVRSYSISIYDTAVLGINSTSNAGSNFHKAKLSEISCITSVINP